MTASWSTVRPAPEPRRHQTRPVTPGPVSSRTRRGCDQAARRCASARHALRAVCSLSLVHRNLPMQIWAPSPHHVPRPTRRSTVSAGGGCPAGKTEPLTLFRSDQCVARRSSIRRRPQGLPRCAVSRPQGFSSPRSRRGHVRGGSLRPLSSLKVQPDVALAVARPDCVHCEPHGVMPSAIWGAVPQTGCHRHGVNPARELAPIRSSAPYKVPVRTW